jgi:hypothetical protein
MEVQCVLGRSHVVIFGYCVVSILGIVSLRHVVVSTLNIPAPSFAAVFWYRCCNAQLHACVCDWQGQEGVVQLSMHSKSGRLVGY